MKTTHFKLRETAKNVTDYLDSLAPYVNKFKSRFSGKYLTENDLILLHKLQHYKIFADNFFRYKKTSTDSVSYESWGNVKIHNIGKELTAPFSNTLFIYLVEVYMFFFGPNRYKSNHIHNLDRLDKSIDVNQCSKIHDGWAIARIVKCNDTTGGIENYRNDDKKDIIQLDTLSAMVIKGLYAKGVGKTHAKVKNMIANKNNIKLLITYTAVTNDAKTETMDFELRPDQLSMFRAFDEILIEDMLTDIPFANFIEKNKKYFKPLATRIHKMITATNNAIKSTSERILIGARKRIVYVDAQGRKYTRQNGVFVTAGA